ncbi:MAG: glycine cleavage T C-terminal barrel domain-containing protein [Bacteroidota bacterium]|nr:glycine cleavage T C-terminal barrel domain-containing protein [Bacteroidota bacterium]MDP4232560.1 glycine cleavage T C-terminal barrel domain-containing protein [Bacteroidota bacterium]MDP4242985.1 glycine cleavage T C-terminal barrel domain-containing protein [Bacteroidota bacterium]MDP4286440.1 glycine cleavage T C-terminal barrel domain-containing protein [Bacteroidota bacterium]
MAINEVAYAGVHDSVGLFDASRSFGRLFARGKDAIDLLHRMSTNDLMPMETAKGLAVLTVLTNEKGRIVDVLKVVRDEMGDVALITSKDKEQTVIQWLDKFTIMEDAQFVPATDMLAQYLLCGKSANSILGKYATENLQGAPNSAVFALHIGAANATLVKGPSLAGNGWFILTAQEMAESVWKQLETDVLASGGAVMDDDLFDLLRIENGMPLAPNELNEKHNPLETTIAKDAVSFTKGCYIGQEVIARLDAQGKVQRQLVGLQFAERVPKIGDRICDDALAGTPLGEEIGEITSIAKSPAIGDIGLGYVRGKYANPDTVVSVKDHEGNKLSATLVIPPFNV